MAVCYITRLELSIALLLCTVENLSKSTSSEVLLRNTAKVHHRFFVITLPNFD